MKRIALLLFISLAAMWADDHGPNPRLTGAPGDQTCVSCHTGTALNGGGGSVTLELPGGATYTPGVRQRITIRINDASARRFGFQLTARLASDLSNGQAGSFAAVDANEQVICATGRVAPCASATVLQFAEHTLAGYRAASNTYSVDWTPPATAVGNVRLYVAGNGANGNGSDSGDHIYTANVELTPAEAGPKPAISSTRGVVNGASFETGITPDSWITISGTNLASTTRSWGAADIVGGKLPTTLDGVSVTVNGKAAYVAYISPTQVNAIAPSDTATGTVEVRVKVNGVESDATTATLQAFAPAFFTFDGKYLAATHADASLLGKAGLFSSAPAATTPAKPGETVILYATGLGPTSPTVAAGQVTDALAAVTNEAKVTIGGVAARVAFAGLVPPFARLYQLNVVVPDAVADGDQQVVAQVGGVNSPQSAACCWITVAR